MFRRVCALCGILVLFAALIRLPGVLDAPEQNVFVPRALAEENENRRRDYELIEVLADALDEIDRSYYREVDRAELVEAAIHGMMSKLDKNSKFITGDAAIQPLRRQLQGEYDGVGIDLASDGGSPQVISPLIGSPAYRAGIRPGDHITAIEGYSTEGAELKDVLGRMRKEPGSEIEITVLDAATQTTKRVKLKSAAIKVETVFGVRRNADDSWDFMYDDQRKIGYIRLTSFSRTSIEPIMNAAQQLAARGVRALVFDLRFNEGGYLPETFKIAGMFLSEGDEIVTINGRSALKGAYHADKDGPLAHIPLAVLVNQRSGSGSEIVASCVQDVRPNSVIVGQRTYGKGTVQSLIKVDEGRSLLKLTTAEYRRPSGKNIHREAKDQPADEWGVRPDEGFDVTLDRAETLSLARHLRRRQAAANQQAPAGEEASRSALNPGPTVPVSTELNADEQPEGANGAAQPFVDRQFDAAVEHLRTQLDKQ